MAVEERLAPIIAQKCLVHRIGGDRQRQGQVASGETLGQAQQVGRHRSVLAGEHLPGAPEAGHHLVRDQQQTVPVAQRSQQAQHGRLPDQHASRCLQHRLDDHRRDLVGAGL
ncbi:MAG: hypothetical protein OXD30_10200, partial [Bryobacterales bacterium]|nr:hypothetical protein [Bryobacterales bacterium]